MTRFIIWRTTRQEAPLQLRPTVLDTSTTSTSRAGPTGISSPPFVAHPAGTSSSCTARTSLHRAINGRHRAPVRVLGVLVPARRSPLLSLLSLLRSCCSAHVARRRPHARAEASPRREPLLTSTWRSYRPSSTSGLKPAPRPPALTCVTAPALACVRSARTRRGSNHVSACIEPAPLHAPRPPSVPLCYCYG